MCCDVPFPDALPRPAVPLAGGWVAVILFVAAGLLLGVFLAEPSAGQPGAAGVGAGALGLGRHGITSWSERKATAGIDPAMALDSFLLIIILPEVEGGFQWFLVAS